NALYDKINSLPTVGGVSSVFGRSGAITAQEADYAAFYAKLSEAYANPSWITSLDWSKITGRPSWGLVENSTVTGSYDLDWSNSTWNLVLTGATTLTQSNLPAAGQTKTITIYVTGNFAITMPSGWADNLSGEYDGTVLNQIVVEYI